MYDNNNNNNNNNDNNNNSVLCQRNPNNSPHQKMTKNSARAKEGKCRRPRSKMKMKKGKEQPETSNEMKRRGSKEGGRNEIVTVYFMLLSLF